MQRRRGDQCRGEEGGRVGIGGALLWCRRDIRCICLLRLQSEKVSEKKWMELRESY